MLAELRSVADLFGENLQSITYSVSFAGRTKAITINLQPILPRRKAWEPGMLPLAKKQ